MASIRKRKNSYQITVSNGRRADGSQIIETATFTPDPTKTERQNQKALEKFVFEFEEKVLSGKYLDGEKLTYKQYIDLWLEEYARKQMQPTSLERSEDALNKLILPELGHLKLAKIQPLHIQRFYDTLIQNGYKVKGERREYKTNTIKRIHQIISSTLNTAVRWQLIENNPCSRISPPKIGNATTDIKCFSLEEAQIFLDQLDQEYTIYNGGKFKADGTTAGNNYEIHKVPLQMKVFFYLALFGGFRLGELVALTWDDIDFQNNTVSITKSTAKTKNGQITKCPKTPTSIRTVTLPADVIQLVKQYKIEQAKYRLSLGSYWKGEEHLFIQNDGKQINIGTPNHTFKKIIRRYNETASNDLKLPDITLHGLRHTSATLLIAQNIDVRTVSGRLGHAKCSTTMNIYAHALKKQDEVAADSLGNLFKKQG